NIYPVGTTIITWTVSDQNNNTALCEQKVIITDNQNPSIVCPSSKTVNTNPGKCFASGLNLDNPTVSDNCGLASIKNDLPSQLPIGLTIVTWTVTDVNGNKNSCTQMITVRDNSAPTIITCPPAQKVVAGAGCKAAIPNFVSNIVATDNCTPTNQLVITQSPSAGTLVGAGITAVQITVKDAFGNARTCTTSFTVCDVTPPTIICPANI